MKRTFNEHTSLRKIEKCRLKIKNLELEATEFGLESSVFSSGIDQSGPSWKEIITGPFENRKGAAVLVVFTQEEDGLNMLLTVRNQKVSLHYGEISFPGGRMETSDITPTDTALREAYEEIGLDRSHVEILGALPPYVRYTKKSGSRTLQRSILFMVVGILKKPFEPKINLTEVQEIFCVPSHNFLSAEPSLFHFWSADHVSYEVCLNGETFHVWGMSYMIAVMVSLFFCDSEKPMNKRVQDNFMMSIEYYDFPKPVKEFVRKMVKEKHNLVANL